MWLKASTKTLLYSSSLPDQAHLTLLWCEDSGSERVHSVREVKYSVGFIERVIMDRASRF